MLFDYTKPKNLVVDQLAGMHGEPVWLKNDDGTREGPFLVASWGDDTKIVKLSDGSIRDAIRGDLFEPCDLYLCFGRPQYKAD